MFPAFAHFRRTATRDTELHGQPIREGEKVVMWYVSSNRDESRYEDPDRFDVTRNPEHQAFGAGGRHFCLGAALARLELRILLEETLARYPGDGAGGRPRVRRVAVHQPAQDAAGPAAPVAIRRPARARPRPAKNSISSCPTRSGSSCCTQCEASGRRSTRSRLGTSAAVGLGQLGADVTIALAPDDQRRGLDRPGPRPGAARLAKGRPVVVEHRRRRRPAATTPRRSARCPAA